MRCLGQLGCFFRGRSDPPPSFAIHQDTDHATQGHFLVDPKVSFVSSFVFIFRTVRSTHGPQPQSVSPSLFPQLL